MAVTILSQPPAYSPAKNINISIFKLQADSYITTAGTTYSATINISSQPAANESLIFAFPALPVASVMITFVSTTPSNDFQCQIGADTTATIANLYAVLRKNYNLHKYFIINTLTSTSFNLTARKKGADYSPTITGTALADFLVVSSAGTTEVVKEDLRIIVDIFQAENNIISKSYVPNEVGQIEIDIAHTLLSYISFTAPQAGQTTPLYFTNNLLNYFIRYCEYYNDTFQTYTQSDSFTAVYAGLAERRIYGNTFGADYFTSNSGRKFMTQVPRGELWLANNTPLYLTYYNTIASYLEARVTYTDGTTDLSDALLALNTLNQCVHIPCGYATLVAAGMTVNSNKTVDFVEVYVVKQGESIATNTHISELFKFHIDHRSYAFYNYAIFLNSLSGFDTVIFNGSTAKETDIKGTNYTVYPPKHTEILVDGELRSETKKFGNTTTFRTGAREKVYIDYLQELLKSEYILMPDGNKFTLMRCELEGSKALYDEFNNLHYFEFELQHAQINRGY
jgi:hypothetical protein